MCRRTGIGRGVGDSLPLVLALEGGEGLCEGYGCGRKAGTERFLCLYLGGHVGQVGGVVNWFGERVGRVGACEWGARCWGFQLQGWRLGEAEQLCVV